ncbi:hypothetical protein BJY52DRAFT_50917 [Lactarius psammicola]|nr:hypothetical protein BJY52DRAFT_50917 [Lactarius psammicola]
MTYPRNSLPTALQHDVAFTRVPDRRPDQRAYPHRRHLTSCLSRCHICPGSEILGVSAERHDADEDLRLDSSRALVTMHTTYKLWYILIYFEHWSTSPLVWADLFLNGLICTICETSLIRRCWKVTKKRKWVTAPLAFLLITIFIANVYLSIALGLGSKHGTVNDSPLREERSFPAKFSFNYWIFGSLVLDVTITSILMVWLCQSKTGLDNLDQALDHIVAVTWESAAVPSAFQIVAVSLYDSKSGESHHLVLFFSLMTGKLYTLGILRSLNSRPDLRGRMTSDDIGRRSLSDWQWGSESENTVSRGWSEVRMPSCLQPEMLFLSPPLSPATTPRGRRLCGLPENNSTTVRQIDIPPVPSVTDQSDG